MSATDKIAGFVVDCAYESLPSEAIAAAKDAFLDCVGVALAGSREKSARIAAELARDEGAKAEATVFGQGFKSSASMAALANGTAAHALDFDHSFALQGQPTAALIPAILTLGEPLGTRGRDLLAAYVAVFEVTGKLARAIPELSAMGGWHSTATLGTIGAAAGGAKLYRLDRAATEMALGIAASMASGIVGNFATMTKPLHCGLGARNGVMAARLAARGFTSSGSIFERPGGFFGAFSRGLSLDEGTLAGLGSRFELVESGIRIKPYPCGGLTHSAVDGLLELRRRHRIEPGAVVGIRVGVTRHTYGAIVYRIPETGLQGKFSMPYILARALINGTLGLEDFTDEAVKDPGVRKLAEKIHMELDPELREGADGARPSVVTVRLLDGSALTQRMDYSRGGREAPLSAAELNAKFVACARKAMADDRVIEAIADSISRLEELDRTDRVARLLEGRMS